MRTKIAILFCIVFAACNTDDTTSSVADTTVSAKEYYPLTIGSYWVYAVYDADTTWSTFTFAFNDSAVITKDTVINGATFKKIQRSWFGDIYIRDSAGTILRSNGLPIFSISPGASLFNNYTLPYDTMYTMSIRMAGSDSTFTVPAGQFLSKYVIGSLDSKASVAGWEKHRTFNIAFAKNIGCVYERVHWIEGGGGFDIRLLRYSIK